MLRKKNHPHKDQVQRLIPITTNHAPLSSSSFKTKAVQGKVRRPMKPVLIPGATVPLTSRSRPPFPQRAAAAAGEVGPSSRVGLVNYSKRRRRPQKRKASARGCADGSLEPRPEADCDCAPPSPPPGHSFSTPCVLDWIGQIARAEDLFREVVVSIVSDRPSVPGNEIAELVVPWLEEEPTSLVLH
jgi:hypothetical protein